MRTERASYFWGAGALAVACGVAAVLLRVLGFGVSVGSVVVGWDVFAMGAMFATILMTVLAHRAWVRVLGSLVLAPLVAIVALAGLMLLGSGGIPSLPVRSAAAPGPRPYAAVVRESRDWIDSVYDLSVDGPTPIGPSWDIGCVNGDYQELVDVRWRSREQLTVSVDSGDGPETATISVDPTWGRPIGPLPELLQNC